MYPADPRFFLCFDHVLISLVPWLLSSLLTLAVWRPNGVIWALVFLPIYVSVVAIICISCVYREYNLLETESRDEYQEIKSQE